jgi:hypothetical protein
MDKRCGRDGGVLIVLAAAYDRPGRGTRVGDGKDCGGSGFDRPGLGSLLCSGASQGVCAIVIFIAIFD